MSTGAQEHAKRLCAPDVHEVAEAVIDWCGYSTRIHVHIQVSVCMSVPRCISIAKGQWVIVDLLSWHWVSQWATQWISLGGHKGPRFHPTCSFPRQSLFVFLSLYLSFIPAPLGRPDLHG